MALKVYNTLTRTKEELVPLNSGEVRIYVCGVTVYDLAHVGHARSALVFDMIRRYLRFKGYGVRFVKNFTDVDDKIISRAREEGRDWRELAEHYVREYQEDMKNLGVDSPDREPRATEFIPQMIHLVEQLSAKGFAYRVNGDVYFEVRSFPRYGRLSGKNLEELLVGARVEVDERKRDPMDFALWKASKPGEPAWESPWGPGRPGWHIECSAMSMCYLGESFDIHGGGEDLIFPHHENEIAQSEAATDKPFVRYWIHNGFVNFGKEKMSKSLGNILTIKELIRRHDPEALRLYLLGTHYRNPVEFAEEHVREAADNVEYLRGLVFEAKQAPADESSVSSDPAIEGQLRQTKSEFEAAMDDDFNTPQAKAALFGLAGRLYAYRDLMIKGERRPEPFVRGVEALKTLAGTLGLLQGRSALPEDWGFIPRPESQLTQIPRRTQPDAYQLLNAPPSDAPTSWWTETKAKIESLIKERDEARKRHDWKRADELREQITALGAIVEDTPAGTRWKWRRA